MVLLCNPLLLEVWQVSIWSHNILSIIRVAHFKNRIFTKANNSSWMKMKDRWCVLELGLLGSQKSWILTLIQPLTSMIWIMKISWSLTLCHVLYFNHLCLKTNLRNRCFYYDILQEKKPKSSASELFKVKLLISEITHLNLKGTFHPNPSIIINSPVVGVILWV